MIKQAVLFVASAGLLVYFVMPVDETEQNEPVVQAAADQKPVNEDNSSNSWEAEDGAEEEESVFGEPLAYSENERSDAEEKYEIEGVVSKASNGPAIKAARKNYVSPSVYLQSPKPGGPGSKENPIDMSPPGGRQ